MRKILIISAILFFAAVLDKPVNAQETNASDKQSAKTQEKNYDQNIVVINKPRPDFARSCSPNGEAARVRVTFDKSEKVTEVEVVASSGCQEFDENSVAAAKKIEFKAATKNGEPVTVTKVVEYKVVRYRRPI